MIHRRPFLLGLAGSAAAASMPWAPVFAEAPKKGGVLKLTAQTGISSYDPVTGKSGDDHMQLYPLYDALCDYDFETMKPVPGLATAWRYSDPKTLVLDLRPNVKFHDGTPFNAAAVKFNLDRAKTAPRSNIKADVGSIDSVEVTGDLQVTLHLNKPDAALPLILSDRAGMMASPAAVQKSGDDYDWNPVGTGMMKFVEYRQKERSTYARNENYWKPNRPYLDGMQYTMITDSQTALRSVMAGENDFIYALTPQQLDTAKQAGLKGGISPALASQIIYFNWGRGPLADLRVRQAMNYGIDCAAFNKVINKGKFEIADEMLPKEHWAYDKGLAGWHPYNPGKAKQLLKEAGLADGVEIAMYAQADQLSQQRVEVMSEQLKKAGIRLKISTGQIPELAKSFFSDKQGDALLAGWTGRPDPSLTYSLMFGKSSFFNPGGQETPGLEDALAETRASSELEARKQAFAKVQKIVIDNALWAPIVFLEQVVAYNAKVRGYRPTLLGKPRFDDVSFGA